MRNVPDFSENYCGLTIEIFSEDAPENPFKEWDGLPGIIGWHRRYDFNTRKQDSRKTAGEFLEEAEREGYYIRPLFMYEHSGLAFSLSPFSCRWDSGRIGFMFLEKEDRETPEEDKKRVESAIKLLNDYVSGNVFGFSVKTPDGEEVDSCWGFFGDYDSPGGALEAARESADSWLAPESLPLFRAATARDAIAKTFTPVQD